ncbi:MAG: hypothetical protein AAGI01_00220 [Myxococcota bacterium]
MSAAPRTIDITPDRPVDELLVFLPPATRRLVLRVVDMLEGANVHVDEIVAGLLEVGESILGSGLDATVDGLEALVERIYEAGWMEALGSVHPFLRDGAEIGIQLGLNTLKAMTPGDLAKIIGLAVIAAVVPNLLVANGPEFLELAVALVTKLWHLP